METYRVIAAGLLLIALWMTSPNTGFAQAQRTLSDEEKLEQDFTNSLSTLPQLLIQDSYTPALYAPCTPPAPCWRDDETNSLIVRPLIPRFPPNTLLPFSQLIRPTFSLVTVPSSRGGTRTEFGDLPFHNPTTLPLNIGLGRTIVRPGLPPMSLFVTGQWIAYRQCAPIAPQTTINFGLTVALAQCQGFWKQESSRN